MTSAPTGPTEPEAGVIATSPATAPVAMPTAVGFLATSHSTIIHEKAAVAVATCVTNSAMPAVPSAFSSLPALKPNQPTHSMLAPTTVNGTLCGGIATVPYPFRLRRRIHSTKPATPALTCTTVPPAKSIAPSASPSPSPSGSSAMSQLPFAPDSPASTFSSVSASRPEKRPPPHAIFQTGT